jgi:hypothetical protein
MVLDSHASELLEAVRCAMEASRSAVMLPPVEATLSMVDVFSFVRTKGFLKHPDDCHHFHDFRSDF